MLKLFKKLPIVQSMLPGKTTKEIIEEIHETFYTEVDKLLASARVSNSLETDQQQLLDKCERLKALGFSSTKEVIEAEIEIKRLSDLKKENESKRTLIDAISYFNIKYPNYKFITEESVKKICSKYNLIYGNIGNYIGTVPDKNLKHIEDFQINIFDKLYSKWTNAYYSSGPIFLHYLSLPKPIVSNDNMLMSLHSNNPREHITKCPLEIVAPIKDFNMRDMEVKDYQLSKIEIPDPVVLQPVIFNHQKYYLIVTAWGEEASDELVVNQKMN